MPFKNAYIPYGQYWSTPFSRWQNSFQNLHAMKFAAEITTRFLNNNEISPSFPNPPPFVDSAGAGCVKLSVWLCERNQVRQHENP